jgi:hypothetical protein
MRERSMFIISILIAIISGCTSKTDEKENLDEMSKIKNARREIVFDSFMNPRKIRWFHNNKVYFEREFDDIEPEVFSIKYFVNNVDTSLMKLPQIKYSQEENEVLLMFTFHTYPSILSKIRCEPGFYKAETYNLRSQILLYFHTPQDSIDISIDYLNDKEKIIKKLEKITLVLVNEDK